MMTESWFFGGVNYHFKCWVCTGAHLEVHAHPGTVDHALAPVSADDLLLLFTQKEQLFTAAVHELIERRQMLPALLTRPLHSNTHIHTLTAAALYMAL